MSNSSIPPGSPGITPRWTSSAKSGVGTSASAQSPVWFTISHGILNEVYFPRLDSACIRDFGFLVTAKDYFSDEKRDSDQVITMIEDGVPAFCIVNTAKDGRYRITKTILTDPEREVVLQDIRFEALVGDLGDFRLHALVAPHLVNAGADNTAWCADFKGRDMLFAEGRGTALAVASSVPWLARSAGYVGTSDGWQTLTRGEGVRSDYMRAERGNVALTGTVDLTAARGRALIALGFGHQPEEAALRALISLQRDVNESLDLYRIEWRELQKKFAALDEPITSGLNRYRVSTAVLASHRDVASGAMIASLSIPWGSHKSDDDLGGYHLVWPRDLVETAGGLLAAGDAPAAVSVLNYLMAIQEADGHWVQNSWLDGRAYWHGVQLDETAFPILLYDMLLRQNAFTKDQASHYLPMVTAAAGYLVRVGPATQQDRWEEDGGYSPFTLAVEIAALLAAADALDAARQSTVAKYLRETADGWHAQIDDWTYATDTELARKLGIEGYYMRIGFSGGDGTCRVRGLIPIRNRADGNASLEAGLLVSPDALAFVRFGLRDANDPRMINTVKAIDSLLRRELPAGPYWYRYNDDGYGEHENGYAFDGVGIGRLWPLLTGERAHYELAAGRPGEAARLLRTMEASSSNGGLIPEQIWDSEDIPARELFLGRPSGSAMPLVWAHAEHVKLLRSLKDGAVFDMPPQTYARYVANSPLAAPQVWRLDYRVAEIRTGAVLRIELLAGAIVHWTDDDWSTTVDTPAAATGLGTYICDLPTQALVPGRVVRFTLHWADRWEGADFAVTIRARP